MEKLNTNNVKSLIEEILKQKCKNYMEIYDDDIGLILKFFDGTKFLVQISKIIS